MVGDIFTQCVVCCLTMSGSVGAVAFGEPRVLWCAAKSQWSARWGWYPKGVDTKTRNDKCWFLWCVLRVWCFMLVLKHIIYISANNGQWWQSNLSGCQRLNPWEALQELQSPRLPSSLPSLVPSSKLPGDPVTIDVLPPVRDTDGPALVPGAAHVRVSLPLVDNSESRLSCFSSFCFDSFLFLVCLVLFALWYSNMYSIPSRRKWCGAAIWLHFTMKLEVGWCPLQLSFPWACN